MGSRGSELQELQKNQGFARPGGDITTLLDLTPRDFQDQEMFPLSAEKTWWLPDQTRRIHPFSLSVQEFPFRGPAAFGQLFTFDLRSVGCGDLLLNTTLQIELGHWLDDTTLLRLESGKYQITSDYWAYANSLGSVIIEKAELVIGDSTIETLDGDFLYAASLLFPDLNRQFGVATDGLGVSDLAKQNTQTLKQTKPFPTQDRTLYIPLPFFFQRIRLAEALPILACKEGSIKINITLRPFAECVRILGKARQSCDQVPLGIPFQITNYLNAAQQDITVQSSPVIPQFKKITLVTYAANTDGVMRKKILRNPFEILRRDVATFHFTEPLKYAINTPSSDTITVQLPLELNHPMEEILWFVRRKSASSSLNEWINYSAVPSIEYDPVFKPFKPLLKSASIQFNGQEIIHADEQWFRQHISLLHKGGSAAYSKYLYGYSFSTKPGEHQPSGTLNASRLQSIRLNLTIQQPFSASSGGNDYGLDWEVKVFVIGLQWLRFQDGLANKMFMD